MRWARSFLAAVALFSVLPVPGWATDRPPVHVVRWLPGVGVVLAALAVLPALAVWRGGGQGSAPLAATLVVATLAAATRGLHLDGLADLADGLGSGRPVAGALAVMKQSDVGPFGVLVLVLTLLLQVTALAVVLAGSGRAQGACGVLVAVLTGRVAVVLAAGPRVPSARPGGLGALVAGTAGSSDRALALALLAAAVALDALTAAGPGRVLAPVLAATAGLTSATLLRRTAVQRLGGVTGDVFGALVEVATTVVWLVLALARVWT